MEIPNSLWISAGLSAYISEMKTGHLATLLPWMVLFAAPIAAVVMPPTSEAAFDLVAKRDDQIPFCGGDDTKDGVVWEPKLEAAQASAQGVSPWKGTVGWKGVQFGANGAWKEFCRLKDCTVSHCDPVPCENDYLSRTTLPLARLISPSS